MDIWKFNQYKIGCLNSFQHLNINFRRAATVSESIQRLISGNFTKRKLFIPKRLRNHEFKNNSQTRRHQLYQKTSTNCNSPEEIFGWFRSTRSRSFRAQFRRNRSLWLQARRSQSLQLQLSRCNVRSSIPLESQSIQLQSEWSFFGWYRSRMVQSQRLYHSPSQYPKNDPSSPVSFWKGDL